MIEQTTNQNDEVIAPQAEEISDYHYDAEMILDALMNNQYHSIIEFKEAYKSMIEKDEKKADYKEVWEPKPELADYTPFYL